MQDVGTNMDRRGFGRRQSDIRGAVVVMGKPPKPFAMRDMSEGGALLCFDDPTFVPPKSFRVTVDGANLVLMCELRHQGDGSAGVRFIKPAEGLALQRHFHLKPVDGVARPSAVLSRRPVPTLQHARGLELRAALDLVVPAATIAQQAEAAGRARARSWAVSRMAVIRACAAAALIVRGGDLVQQAASHPHVETDHANGPKHS